MLTGDYLEGIDGASVSDRVGRREALEDGDAVYGRSKRQRGCKALV